MVDRTAQRISHAARLLWIFLAVSVAASAQAVAQPVTNPTSAPTMQTPIQVHLIYWKPGTAIYDASVSGGIGNYESLTTRFFQEVGFTNYFQTVGQYAVASTCGTAPCALQNQNAINKPALTWPDSTTPYNKFNSGDTGTQQQPLFENTDIRSEIRNAISTNGWTAGPNSLFIVFLAANVQVCMNSPPFVSGSSICSFGNSSAGVLCGRHNQFTSSGTQIIYAYVTDASTNACNEGTFVPVNGQLVSDREVALMTHEFFEAIVDPVINTWADTNGNEIGDICNQQPATVDLNGNQYIVQKLWSNAANACVPPFPAASGPPAPTGCYVWSLVCGNEATLTCDPPPSGTLLSLAGRNSSLTPLPDFTMGGTSSASAPNIVYDAPSAPDFNQFRACQVNNVSGNCVAPLPYSPYSANGCPGGPSPPKPPTPGQCRKEGCSPRPGGGCLCQ
jgi:hypothetical protein